MSMWRDTDAVASWSWAGCEGKRNKITVYSDGDTAELILNGRSCGKKKTKEYKAAFKHIAYEPGTITAISYDSAGKALAVVRAGDAPGGITVTVRADGMQARTVELNTI